MKKLGCLMALFLGSLSARGEDAWVAKQGVDYRLEVATAQNDLVLAEILLNDGADPNKHHAENVLTPLTDAVYSKKLPFVKLLLDHGANINGLDSTETPLMAAAALGSSEIFEFLLQHGADYHLRGPAKENAFMVAGRCYQADLLDYIATHHPEIVHDGDTLNEALLSAAESGASQSVRELLKLGATVDTRSGGEQTPLIDACMWGYTVVAQILLQHGADVNARDNWNNTPLHMAVSSGNVKTVKLLLGAGADPTIADTYEKETPLQQARRLGHKDIAALIRAALKRRK